MTDQGSSTIIDPSQWATGEESATDKQKGFAKKLAADTGDEFDESMNKGDTSKFIEEHKNQSSAGRNAGSGGDDATEKQKGYIAVLEKKAGESVTAGNGLDRNEASDKISSLKDHTGA